MENNILEHPLYKGLMVSEIGEVWYNNKKIKQTDDMRGYLRVNYKSKSLKVHRLVAETFIPNPKNKPQVDHIDCNKYNNNKNNLRWVTGSENCKNRKNGERKEINMYDLDGNFIKTYKSAYSLTKEGYHQQNVLDCCRGKQKTCKGKIFKFKEEVK